MKKIHKILSFCIFVLTAVVLFFFKAQMSDAIAQNLVTFFSVVFGFYMTSVAILYNASYTKRLHKQIDKIEQKRGTHTLKSYLLTSGYWSIFSIAAIIIFTTFPTKGFLNLFFSALLFGITALNIFYMLLLMHTIIDGMLEEAKDDLLTGEKNERT